MGYEGLMTRAVWNPSLCLANSIRQRTGQYGEAEVPEPPVVDDYIEIPKELIATQREVTLCMDGMKVNGLAFLTTVSHNLQYRTTQFIKQQTPEVYRQVLEQIFRVYNTGGFQVTTQRCDNKFRPLIEPLDNDIHVGMNFANAQEHVP